MRLYHGTHHHHVTSGRFSAGLYPNKGQLGSRFYLTPIVEVAMWFALCWAQDSRRRPPGVGWGPAVLVFDLTPQDYGWLLKHSLVLGLTGLNAPRYRRTLTDWGKSALAEPLVVAPIAGDWEDAANGVQYALDARGIGVIEPYVPATVADAWGPGHPAIEAFRDLTLFEAWGIQIDVL